MDFELTYEDKKREFRQKRAQMGKKRNFSIAMIPNPKFKRQDLSESVIVKDSPDKENHNPSYSGISVRRILQDSQELDSVSTSQITVINQTEVPSVKQSRQEIQLVNQSNESLRNSLPTLGLNPTTVFCKFCQFYVHTKIDYKNQSCIQGSFYKTISQMFQCCSLPVWLREGRVHLCSQCNKILARTQ